MDRPEGTREINFGFIFGPIKGQAETYTKQVHDWLVAQVGGWVGGCSSGVGSGEGPKQGGSEIHARIGGAKIPTLQERKHFLLFSTVGILGRLRGVKKFLDGENAQAAH